MVCAFTTIKIILKIKTKERVTVPAKMEGTHAIFLSHEVPTSQSRTESMWQVSAAQEGKCQKSHGRHRNQGHRSDWRQFTVFSPPLSLDLTSVQPKPRRNMVVQRESSRKENSSHSKSMGEIPSLFSHPLLCSLRPQATTKVSDNSRSNTPTL